MVVLPVDALALSAPALWVPQHAKAVIAMAVLPWCCSTAAGGTGPGCT